jgi:hypothetical protein
LSDHAFALCVASLSLGATLAGLAFLNLAYRSFREGVASDVRKLRTAVAVLQQQLYDHDRALLEALADADAQDSEDKAAAAFKAGMKKFAEN